MDARVEALFKQAQQDVWNIIDIVGSAKFRHLWPTVGNAFDTYKLADRVLKELQKQPNEYALLVEFSGIVSELNHSIRTYMNAQALKVEGLENFPKYLNEHQLRLAKILKTLQEDDIRTLLRRMKHMERPMETNAPVIVTDKDIATAMATEAGKIAEYKNELNLDDSTSVISWGTGVQKKVRQLNAQMLDGVKSNEVGEVGDMLNAMVLNMRGLDFGKAAKGDEVGFFGKLLGKISPLAEFVQGFEEVKGQIEATANKLEIHKVDLLKSIKQLDQLYLANLEYFRELGNYIAAGEEIIKELDEVEIPKLKESATSGDLLDAQNLNDLIAKRDAFDRRVHDIKLTRQVVMQSLPQVRMVQNNDKGLVQKIDTQLINTIPMWESQMVIAVEQWKMRKAAATTKQVSDFQNELLVKNAENLKQGNAEVRRELERGVYDIESVKKANDLVIATIEESIAITQEGRAQRIEAANALVEAESKLKVALERAA